MNKLTLADPTFAPGSVHTATVSFTNTKGIPLDYTVELYLLDINEVKRATSGMVSFSLNAGESKDIEFSGDNIITMPEIPGACVAWLAVYINGVLNAYSADPNIITIGGFIPTPVKKVSDFLVTAQQWKDWKEEGIWIICPLCGARIQGATCVAEGKTCWNPWMWHLQLHSTSHGGNLPPVITIEEYRYWLNYRYLEVDPATPTWHCLIDYLYSTYDKTPPVGSFELTNIHGAGFDGQNAWFDVDVSISHCKDGECWSFMMVAIRESDYAAFLADIGNPYRACDDEGCSILIYGYKPEGSPRPKPLWPWWEAWLKTEAGKILPITESGRYSTILPFEGYIRPEGVVTVRYGPLQPGNYVVLMDCIYKENSWGIPWCTLWEIGRIRF